MKIGKWLAKVHDLASKRQEIIQLFWKIHHEKVFKGERPYEGGQTNFSGQPTGKILEFIGEEKYERYEQLTDQLKMYAGLQWPNKLRSISRQSDPRWQILATECGLHQTKYKQDV